MNPKGGSLMLLLLMVETVFGYLKKAKEQYFNYFC